MAEPMIDLSKVPEEYYGDWVAVDKKTSEVVAHAGTMREVTELAEGKDGDNLIITVIEPCAGGYFL